MDCRLEGVQPGEDSVVFRAGGRDPERPEFPLGMGFSNGPAYGRPRRFLTMPASPFRLRSGSTTNR